MSQFTQKKLTTKVMEKAIKASIKKEIVARGINATTHQGNKELKFLISKLASQSFDNLEQAKVAGEKMGQHLSELLQQKNKQNLDAGLIRQVTFQKDFWSLAGLSAPKPSPTKVSSPEESEPIDATSNISDAENEETWEAPTEETQVSQEIDKQINEIETTETSEEANKTSFDEEDLSPTPVAQTTEEISTN